ncbi:hypothetical protein ABZ468_40715 [Streptomyces sp. NPDC005708]|uniref:hypothetical protein n=1 Tax=Streptomyces sp. NPDC005708 TaxID=3154564 RepID=UPI0033DFE881
MERGPLERLLVGKDDASVAALAALRSGGSHVIWDRTASPESLAHIYGHRLEHTCRKGIETTSLERTVELLGRHRQPVRLGLIKAADGSWVFMLFLAEDGSSLIACTGVRQTHD